MRISSCSKNKADLVLDGISKTYRGGSEVPAVNGIKLSVEQGQFLTLLGPSGCGKTTLLRIIGGFIAASAGRISVQGNDITELPPQKRPTAMVFQNYALFPHMTTADNVAFGLKVRRWSKADIVDRVQSVLSIVNLADFGNRYPHQLSGGQQQRVALARALAVEPPVLLMDEPLGALDAKLREEMQFELCAIQRRLGITTIYVTHDQEEAFNMSDMVAVMNQGRILQLGKPDEIYHRPTSTFVAEFVGRSNVLHGRVCSDLQAMETSDGLTLAVALPAKLKAQTPVAVIIRPEVISIGSSEASDNQVDGVIEHRRLTGGTHLYYVRIGPDSTVVAEDRRRVPFSPGEKVQLSWRRDQSIVLPDDPATATA